MVDRLWYEDIPIPSLMREARAVYRDAVRRGLTDAGCDDVPRNGMVVLAGLDQSMPVPWFTPIANHGLVTAPSRCELRRDRARPPVVWGCWRLSRRLEAVERRHCRSAVEGAT